MTKSIIQTIQNRIQLLEELYIYHIYDRKKLNTILINIYKLLKDYSTDEETIMELNQKICYRIQLEKQNQGLNIDWGTYLQLLNFSLHQKGGHRLIEKTYHYFEGQAMQTINVIIDKKRLPDQFTNNQELFRYFKKYIGKKDMLIRYNSNQKNKEWLEFKKYMRKHSTLVKKIKTKQHSFYYIKGKKKEEIAEAITQLEQTLSEYGVDLNLCEYKKLIKLKSS